VLLQSPQEYAETVPKLRQLYLPSTSLQFRHSPIFRIIESYRPVVTATNIKIQTFCVGFEFLMTVTVTAL
jgi:hypothetical protein